MYRHVMKSEIPKAASDIRSVLRLGTPWLLKRGRKEHHIGLPGDVRPPSSTLGTGSVHFSNLTIVHVDEYSTAYFSTFNMLLPLLDPDIFMDRVVARLLREGYQDDDPESFLALTVFALGQLAIESVHDRPPSTEPSGFADSQQDTVGSPPGLRLFNEARRRIGLAGTRCCLENVQIMLLQATYYEANAQHSEFWSSISAASLACIYLINGQAIDWSSQYGDLVKRAYWTCVLHERLFDLDLKVALTGIETMEDEIPFPHFHGTTFEGDIVSLSSRIQEGFVPKGQRDSSYHFLALIALSRLIRRIDDLVHRYESVVSEAKPLWQGQGIRDKESPIVGTSHSESYGGPPIKILDELVCELCRWRSSLPYSLRWSDEDRLAFTNIQPLRQPPYRRLFSRIGLDDPSEIDPSKDIVVAQLRTRYYRARFLVLRPFICKALHNPWLMTAEDRVGRASAVEAIVRTGG